MERENGIITDLFCEFYQSFETEALNDCVNASIVQY